MACLSLTAALPAPGSRAEAAERMRPHRIRPDAQPFDPARDGIVAGTFIAYVGARRHRLSSVILQREGSMDWYRHVARHKGGASAFHLPAGEYFVAGWSPGEVTVAYFPETATQGRGRYLPLSRIEVKAGKAVYFGTVVARWSRDRKREGQILLEVEDDFDKAGRAVERQYPGWGEKLQKKLTTVAGE